MALHALELVLDAASDALVRADWRALAEAGLPSQARHRGATNAPHVTLASAAVIDAGAEAHATATIGRLLPARIDLAGVVLLGRGPYAFARLLAPAPDLQDAGRAVRRRVGDPHSAGWTAHLTLARRLPTAQVGSALAAVATGPAVARSVVATGLRRWDPDAGAARMLAGHGPEHPGLPRPSRDANDHTGSTTSTPDEEPTCAEP
ncbi:2'-5' RNA ligase family protein [Agilicoccus flavus]|uniref:2'-5' RNA ligase family protein n=1 Tax=Agilicoccus flavus TaxID=2775968 RepID=UPI001CF6F86F|nr:2'-5' RNA ligase family protein [Agilicoccus flavus]